MHFKSPLTDVHDSLAYLRMLLLRLVKTKHAFSQVRLFVDKTVTLNV